MNHRSRWLFRWLALATCVVVLGCGHRGPRGSATGPLVVPVSQPVQRKVTDFVDYTGRTAAINSVDIRAQVSGYLVKMPFTEGAVVKQGDLLFEIDPRPFQAQLDVAKGNLEHLVGQQKLIAIQVERFTKLVAKGAASQEQLDVYLGQQAENVGSLVQARAQVTEAALNLDFCYVRAPVPGQVSRYLLTVGNLARKNDSVLTTLVSLDPIYAYFDMDDRTLLRLRRGIDKGTIKPPTDGAPMPVFMGLEGEEGYPHKGTIDFINNQITASTGTISVRGIFPNPRLKDGTRLMPPGMFVRIHFPLGEPQPALLVYDSAIGSEQGLKYVYVVNEEKQVEYRPVQTGPLLPDGLRVIEEGLKPTDWVIVSALERVRPKTQVEPDPTRMPTIRVAGAATN